MEVSHDKIKPGCLLEYRCPKHGIVFQWRVLGVYLGGERQEGLVHVESVMQSPGTDGYKDYKTLMVPEVMVRALTVIQPGG